MNRRILFIVLGAIVVLLIILLAWWWFFNRPQTQQIENGQFGAGGAASSSAQVPASPTTNVGSQVTAGSGDQSNISVNVPLTGGAPGGGAVAGQSVLATLSGSGGVSSGGGSSAPSGVTWLPGGGPTTSFAPSAINQLNGGQIGGKVTIFGSPPQINPKGNSSDLGAALAVVGAGTALCTAGILGGVAVGAAVNTAIDGGVTLASPATGLPVNSIAANFLLTKGFGINNALAGSQTLKSDFLDCIARTVMKALVSQITAGVVNWINGGFNGQPAFVQNFQQFFGNVADQAAGAYIQSSALSFLCSPFSLQIKIAIAQSYANRNNAAACTLSKVSNNIQSFMNGNFAAGGWGGLLQFTTVPTNNPFGAFAYAQIGLAGAQTAALSNATRNITPGGFISFVQASNCSNPSNNGLQGPGGLFLTPQQAAAGICPTGCTCKTTTPGTVIQDTLQSSIDQSGNQLAEAGVAGSFDAIFSALITQLITKTLYNGLSNLSGTAGYASNFLTPDQQQAQTQGNSLLTTLGNLVAIAQNYGATQQGSISDIQNTQQQWENLSNCWESASTSPSLSGAQQATASQNAALAQLQIQTLQAQVDQLNGNITTANNAIAILQGLQTRTLQVGSTADVSAITADLNSAEAQGKLISQDQATTATQNRTTLQSQLQAQQSQVATGLAQCQNFGTTPTH